MQVAASCQLLFNPQKALDTDGDGMSDGEEVRTAFVSRHPQTSAAFTPGRPGKWWADLWALARIRLQTAGVLAEHVAGGGLCTFGLAQRFYSYRRQQITGRQAGCIWVE